MIASLSAAEFKIVLNSILSMQTVAHAEGLAEASEELNAQAGQMKLTVDEPAALIGDAGTKDWKT